MDPAGFRFRRPALARDLVAALLGRGAFSFRSGLFLAAPRRTGKSTFLRLDLMPALAAEAVTTVYCDLWADRTADPAAVIRRAIAAAGGGGGLAGRLGRARITKASALGVSVDLAAADQSNAGTLAEALDTLARKTGRPVALIVDEAQQALSSDTGSAAMFALKAARDAMNQGGGADRLLLVFTGSHRDKLSALVLRRDQPFYGGAVQDLPLLGRDFVEALVAWINPRLAPGNRFDAEDAWSAFRILGHRPELLEAVLRDHALGPPGAGGLHRTVTEGAEALRERVWAQFDSDYGALTPLQQAVLGRIVAGGPRLALFGKATAEALSAEMGAPVSPSAVQSAVEALRERGLVWKSGRSAYALEDQGMADWLAARAGPLTAP